MSPQYYCPIYHHWTTGYLRNTSGYPDLLCAFCAYPLVEDFYELRELENTFYTAFIDEEAGLETLVREKLLAFDVHQSEHELVIAFSISVYRVLPLLTPTQVAELPAATRQAHRRWLYKHAQTLRLSPTDWETLATPTLVPRQPGYRLKPLNGEYQFNLILAEAEAIQESAELGRIAPQFVR